MLSREEVLRVADLAKIELAEEEVERFQKDLSAILDFVGELKKAKRSSVVEQKRIEELESIERKDEKSGLVEEKGQALIEQAPEARDDFVVVPEVFKGEE